ncbi:MAG: IS1182 family transposase [Chloroflexota bacterium]
MGFDMAGKAEAERRGWGMVLRERDPNEMPEDIAAVGAAVLKERDPYRVIGERLAELVRDGQFAELYEPRGRAAVSPSVLMLVTIFQFMENLPDREAARAVRVRLDWKYALHLAVDDPGFDFSCLSYFRRRLLKHEQSRLLFDLVLEQVRGLGFLQKVGKQRTDALGVLGAVRELSQLELVWEALRLALRALGEVDAAWVAQAVPTAYRTQYLERRSDSRLTAEERQAELVRVGQDGAWLLDRLAATDAGVLRTLPEVETLTTIWQQRYERADDGVRWRSKTLDSTELIVTPHDPGVRIGQKRGHVWWGDKVHVTETIAEPPAADDAGPVDPADQVRFITDVTTSPAPSGDGQALAEIRAHLTEQDLLPTEQVVDSGYVSGKHLAESAAAEIDLVGPPLADTSPNGFKIADFTLDHAARQAICPAGQTSTKWAVRRERDGSHALQIRFPAAVCAACPLRPQCTDSKGGRNLSISEHYARLAARRAEAQTPAFREKLKTRAGIEATLSELVRAHGLRRHRYRGDAKRHFEHLLKAAACNVKRLARALATLQHGPFLPPPLTRPAGAFA